MHTPTHTVCENQGCQQSHGEYAHNSEICVRERGGVCECVCEVRGSQQCQPPSRKPPPAPASDLSPESHSIAACPRDFWLPAVKEMQ